MNEKRLDYLNIILAMILLFVYLIIPTFIWFAKVDIDPYIEEIAISLCGFFLVFSVVVDIKNKDQEQTITRKLTLPLFTAFLGIALSFLKVSQGVHNNKYWMFLWFPLILTFVYTLTLSINKNAKWTLILKYGFFMLIVASSIISFLLVLASGY